MKKHEECRWKKDTIRSEMTTELINDAIMFIENPK